MCDVGLEYTSEVRRENKRLFASCCRHSFTNSFTIHQPFIHDLRSIAKELRWKGTYFTKKLALPLWVAFILNYSQSWKAKKHDQCPLFMCLLLKPIKMWRVACSIMKFCFLKVRWDVLYISQYGGSAKFRSTRKFSKDRSRILSIYTLLNFAAATAWLG